MHLCRSSSNVPCLPSFLEMLQNPHVLVTFDKLHNPLRLPRETTSEPPKMVRTWCGFFILTWKCASRHNGVHFFDISTSKSGPTMVFFQTSKMSSRSAETKRMLQARFACSCVVKLLHKKKLKHRAFQQKRLPNEVPREAEALASQYR